jgi:hypothetical protein
MDLVHADDYANFLDIDDNDIFIRKYSDDNVAIYNKRLSPSPDITIIPNSYKPIHKYPMHIPIISSYASVKILYFLFIIVIIYVIVYYLFGTVNVIV